MGEVLKTFGIATVGMVAAYAASNKIDEFVERNSSSKHNKEVANCLKVTVGQVIGIIAFAIDQHI